MHIVAGGPIIARLLALALLPLWAPARAQTTDLPRIGVLDLTSENVPPAEVRLLSDRLRVELFNTGQFTVVERERMEEILREQGFQQSGCTATECVVQIGRLLGADKMVAGSVGRVGEMYTISLRIVNGETGALERTAVKDCRCSIEDVLTTSIAQVAAELAGTAASARAGVTSRPPETPSVRNTNMARLACEEARARDLRAIRSAVEGVRARSAAWGTIMFLGVGGAAAYLVPTYATTPEDRENKGKMVALAALAGVGGGLVSVFLVKAVYAARIEYLNRQIEQTSAQNCGEIGLLRPNGQRIGICLTVALDN
jgi:hypothetical protein